MQLYQNILIIVLNTIAYGLSFYFIFIKREHRVISVRSPVLLILNNVGGFLMTFIFLYYEMIEDVSLDENITDNGSAKEKYDLFCKIIPNNYLICHFLMMISFILRCHRVLECCKINNDERLEIKQFYTKRYLFKERHYIKILFACMIILIFINFMVNLVFTDSDMNLIPFHFVKCMEDPKKGQFNVSMLWVIVNFVEAMVLVSYTYLIMINHIKQLIKFELCAFLAVWIIYPNVLRFSDFYLNVDNNVDSHWTSYLCCFFLWVCLFLNGYLPVVLTYIDNNYISYHFNSKLCNNLYLFLSHDTCFYSFNNFVAGKEREKYYLKLYTNIIKYKFKYTTEPDYFKVLTEAREIFEEDFSDSSKDNFIDNEVNNKIKSNCQKLNKDECTYDLFDDALIFCYQSLENTFKQFKKDEEYQLLIDKLNLNSYIQCKMSNTGLINKF